MSRIGKGLDIEKPIAIDESTRKSAEELVGDIFDVEPIATPKKPEKKSEKPVEAVTDEVLEGFIFKMPRSLHKELKMHVLMLEDKTTMSSIVSTLISDYLKKSNKNG